MGTRTVTRRSQSQMVPYFTRQYGRTRDSRLEREDESRTRHFIYPLGSDRKGPTYKVLPENKLLVKNPVRGTPRGPPTRTGVTKIRSVPLYVCSFSCLPVSAIVKISRFINKRKYVTIRGYTESKKFVVWRDYPSGIMTGVKCRLF